jgi:hypothetical protein
MSSVGNRCLVGGPIGTVGGVLDNVVQTLRQFRMVCNSRSERSEELGKIVDE